MALVALLGTTVLWGASFFVVRAGMFATQAALERAAPGTGAAAHAPTLYLVLRFALASVAALALPGAVRGLGTRRAWIDVALVGAPFFVGFMLQNYGLVETSATVSAFLTSTYVVIVPMIVLVARRERPPLRLILGALLVTGGIALLTGMGVGGPGRGPGGFGRGEVLSLLCAFAFAYQVYLIDGAARRTSPSALTLGTMILTTVAGIAALAPFSGGRTALSTISLHEVVTDATAVTSIAFAGIVPSVAAIYLMYRYQTVVSPTRASIVYASEPAFAALFAAAFGGETFGVVSLSGSALILIGNLVAELRPRPS